MEVQSATATDDRGPRITAVMLTLTSISSVFVSLRLYTRAVIKKGLWAEDYIMALALVTSWGEAGLNVVAVRHGLGRHMWDLTREQRRGAQLWSILGSVTGVFGLGLPKIAMAAMLNRVLLAGYWSSMASWFLSIMSMVNFTVANMLILFQCATPQKAVWARDPDNECYSIRLVIGICMYSSVFSAFGDLYFAVWPALVVSKLYISRPKALGLSCALGLGIIACGVAGYKTTLLPLLADPDILSLITWKVAESAALLTCSSIPFLAPICRVFARWFSRSKARAGDGDVDSVPDLVQSLGRDQRLHHRALDTESGLAALRSTPRHRHRSMLRPLTPSRAD
ncbi:hypothetical protein MCOR27_001043 [Pyricularia oryzae]|uniref:Rhodopsin domain-containing protein n=1 Tax=Pyricularia grisea TaxID=148305 RepID=A0ABQ8NXL2_PYRGI|nr:hypothetical protein MCOR01_007254 [Pyricularia oryzae]KAI6303595.1 hypothetical protein MCOR33_001288 [Pyricularia grisea]KAH9434155.1 hypothetical protein MCOR02_006178 [Pyricularia oryzae]KAI6277627.1 hypothetical protein MCOR26_005018 [Pyricularia oryzae]KAI6287768.1 hypothetical protein MCOR34_010860 [Pyricularia oryzae]